VVRVKVRFRAYLLPLVRFYQAYCPITLRHCYVTGCNMNNLSNFKIHRCVPCKRRSSVNRGAWLWRFDGVPEWKKLRSKSKKRKKSEGKMLYHCNLICVSPKHGMHGNLRCLKIIYIHNC